MGTSHTSPYVFLSYASADSETAKQLKADLRTRGITAWIDQEDIPPGTPDWEAAIRDAICSVRAVLLLASPSVSQSRYVKGELIIAELYQRRIYPIWIKGENWAEAVPLGIVSTQYIDARANYYKIALDKLVEEMRDLFNEPSSTPIPPLVTKGAEPRNPYKGLDAFKSSDAQDFFGRERLVQQLTDTLRAILSDEQHNAHQRLLALIGPSGSGKSSVVMAGLLPRLQAGSLPASQEWTYLAPITPGQHPLQSLVTTLVNMPTGEADEEALLTDLQHEDAHGLTRHVSKLTTPSRAKVVLIVDQFEELFTQTASEEERKQFINLLVHAASEEERKQFIIIVTLRADFSDRPMHYPDLSALIEAHRTLVLPMEIHELRSAIIRPAQLPDVSISFEGDLVGDILFDIRGESGTLPFLEYTLRQLFQCREGHLLTQQAYRDIGGVKGALRNQAEATFVALPTDEQRRLARGLFVRLIDSGISGQDMTRRHANRTEFALVDPEQTHLLQETIDAFIDAHLFTVSDVGGTGTIELSHEALIQAWPRLTQWISEARTDIPLQQKLSKDADEWEQHDKRSDRLYRGTQLKDADAWAQKNLPSLKEAAFLKACHEHHSRVRLIQLSIVLLFILLSGTAVHALFFPTPPPNLTVVTNLNDHGQGSLFQAVASARAGDVITFDPNLKGSITLTEDLVLARNVIIHGPGADRISINNAASKQIAGVISQGTNIHILASASVTIIGISFKNSNIDSDTFINNDGHLILNQCVISGNTGLTGGIDNSGTLEINASDISNNTGMSGGISNTNGAVLTINKSTITDNRAYDPNYTGGVGGGGIDNSGMLTLSDSIVLDNIASFGAGIYTYGANSKAVINNSLIAGNVATGGSGGGIEEDDGPLIISNTTISGNRAIGNDKAPSVGGGIDNRSGGLTLLNSTVGDNIANVGGGLNFIDAQGTVTFSTIYGNTATTGGGLFTQEQNTRKLVYNQKNGRVEQIPTTLHNHVTISNSIVAGNDANLGPDIAGPLIVGGYNLIQSINGTTISDPNHLHSTDITSKVLVDLNIDPLARSNDGPTPTFALLAGSPAIGKIPPDACQLKTIQNARSGIYSDQRGLKRPGEHKHACDIGAFETQ